MFKQSIDSKRKEGVRIAEQFLEKIDGLIMKGLRRELAAAEARVLAGDAGAAADAEFLFLSIRHLLRDRTQLGVRLLKYVLARPRWIFRAQDGAPIRSHGEGGVTHSLP
jgi:hypothetical protein